MRAAMAAHLEPAVAPEQPARLIFGRGGIRGIAMAGAAVALHQAGFRVERAAGISVGGIVAALIMAGYSPDELRAVVWELDYSGMRDGRRPAARIPLLGPAWNLITRLGLYEGDALLGSLRELLERKGVRTFGDLRDTSCGDGSPYRLQVLCADLSRARLVVLPDQAPEYGLDPDELDVALALRMSASLPFVFRPLRLGTGAAASFIVDGGLVAGIPYRLFDCARPGSCATFGIQAGPGRERCAGPITGPLSLLRAGYYTTLKANEANQAHPAAADRTIDIDCGAVGAIDFTLSDPQKQALYDAGLEAVHRFLQQGRREPASRERATRPTALKAVGGA